MQWCGSGGSSLKIYYHIIYIESFFIHYILFSDLVILNGCACSEDGGGFFIWTLVSFNFSQGSTHSENKHPYKKTPAYFSLHGFDYMEFWRGRILRREDCQILYIYKKSNFFYFIKKSSFFSLSRRFP